MRLQKLSVTNNQGETLEFPLGNSSGGFLVKSIDGLGPVKAVLASSEFASLDGAEFHSSRRGSRNIVLHLDLAPNYADLSVYDLRGEIYRFMMPGTKALLTFTMYDKFATDLSKQTFKANIVAHVESAEVGMFEAEPSVDVSLMCFNPDLIDLDTTVFDGASVSDLTETLITYTGTVPTGVLFTFFPTGTFSEFSIYHRTPDEKLHHVDYTDQLFADDVVEINSRRGSKYVQRTREGVQSQLLYAVSQQSDWIVLWPGDNYFRVYADGSPSPFSIIYMNRYGGL